MLPSSIDGRRRCFRAFVGVHRKLGRSTCPTSDSSVGTARVAHHINIVCIVPHLVIISWRQHVLPSLQCGAAPQRLSQLLLNVRTVSTLRATSARESENGGESEGSKGSRSNRTRSLFHRCGAVKRYSSDTSVHVQRPRLLYNTFARFSVSAPNSSD